MEHAFTQPPTPVPPWQRFCPACRRSRGGGDLLRIYPGGAVTASMRMLSMEVLGLVLSG